MTIQALGEVIIYVQDMQKEVLFYRDALGLTVKAPIDTGDYSKEHWVTFETGTCVLALHSGGSVGEESRETTVVFLVENHEAAELVCKRGVSLGPVREPVKGTKVRDGLDPEGHRFALEWRELEHE
jgi:predicted enzyme related to lactoylglutathione lyase